jgi:thiol-disulfide isomerase/thioredoxin
MGRLSALALGLPVLLGASLSLGCDSGKGELPPPPITGRSNAVAAKDGGAAPASSPGAHAAPPPAPGPPRQLCAGQAPRPAPKGTLKTAAAPGDSPPAGQIPFGVGKWTWVNLWAAWCAPCKEEMPRLVGFQSKLSAAGVLLDLVFVSLDDDERQLERFLSAQPKPGGVRASYWLPDGDLRTSWLGALGVRDKAELPVQALVAPSGQVACVIQGAIEDRDYPALAALMGARAAP